MGRALAVRRGGPRRRQDHHARVSVLQPRPQRIPGKRFLPVAGVQIQPHTRRPGGPAAHAHPASSCSRILVEKNTETGPFAASGGLRGAVFTSAAISTGTGGCRCSLCSKPFLPNNKSMDRDWSPLWSLWRAENNPKTGASSQSLLWNLYRHSHARSSEDLSALRAFPERARWGGQSSAAMLHSDQEMIWPAGTPWA